MTNLLAQITINLILATNWTGCQFQGKELGFVTTNHVSEIHYQDQTNIFTLKVVPSEIAVWRDFAPVHYATNYLIPTPWIVTNNLQMR